MCKLIHVLLMVVLLAALPVNAQEDFVLPEAMPEPERMSRIDRPMRLFLDAWAEIPGSQVTSDGDRLAIGDFVPIVLTDGSVVIPGLGLRARDTRLTVRGRPLNAVQIVDVQEFGPFWMRMRSSELEIGSYIGGRVSSLDQALRAKLNRDGLDRLRNGFSIPIVLLIPFTDTRGEPNYQRYPSRLSIESGMGKRGLWLVAEADQLEGRSDPQEAVEELVAEFMGMVETSPCSISNQSMLDVEKRLDVLLMAAGRQGEWLNLRGRRDVACAVEREGRVDVEDVERLLVLRVGTCDTIGDTSAEGISARVDDLRRQLPPSEYIDYARVGISGWRNPELGASPEVEAVPDRECVLQYLEDDLFED